MTPYKCPHCMSGMMDVQSYDKTVKLGRRSVFVHGLSKYFCTTCNGELVTREQFNANRESTVAAIDVANRNSVNPAFLRAFREKHDLTQRAASELFGAGQSSFAKWESGQSALSTPTALLLRCAAEVEGVVDFLADLSGVQVAPVEAPAIPESRPRIYLVGTVSTNTGPAPLPNQVPGPDPRYVPRLYRSAKVSLSSTVK